MVGCMGYPQVRISQLFTYLMNYTFSNLISDNYYLIVWHFSISSLLASINLTYLPIIQCRNAVWLPGPTLEASVTTDICQSCGPGSAPVTQ